MSSDHVTSTTLEREVDAAVSAMAAWCYPADVELRSTAIQACAAVGVDYIESIAGLMSSTNASAHTARYTVFAGFIGRVDALRLAGEEPRPGILGTGRQADGLGRDPASYATDEDDYDA